MLLIGQQSATRIRPSVRTYAQWDPVHKGGGITITNGGLGVSASVWYQRAIAHMGISSGRVFWEMHILSSKIGFGSGSIIPPAGSWVGGEANAAAWYCDYVGVWNSSSRISVGHPQYNALYTPKYQVGDVIGVGLDMDAGTLEFWLNGASRGIAYTGLTGTQYPAVSLDVGGTGLANFGATPLAYPQPGWPAGVSRTYATWNPAKAGTGTFSDGYLTYSNSIPGSTLANIPITVRSYWEVKISSGTYSNAGVANSSLNLTQYTGYDLNSWGLRFVDHIKWHNNSNAGTLPRAPTAAGTWIGLEYDPAAGTLNYYDVGGLLGGFTGITGTVYPAVTAGFYGLSGSTANFGATPFAYNHSGRPAGVFTTP